MANTAISTATQGEITLIQPREVGRLTTEGDWAKEARFVWRARKRNDIPAKVAFQLTAICKQGAALARTAAEIEEGRQDVAGVGIAAQSELGRLQQCSGWVSEVGRLYRKVWQGTAQPGTAMLDTLSAVNAAALNVELELRYEAQRMEQAHQQLQQQVEAPRIEHEGEQPAAAGDVDSYEFDATGPTIRIITPIRVTKD